MKQRIHILLALLIASGVFSFAVVGIAAQDDTDEGDPNTGAPFLGLTFIDMEDSIVVTDLLPDGPAAEAGLMEGDVIVAIDGEDIAPSDFRETIFSYEVGDTVTISVERDGEMIDVEVVLGQGVPQRDRNQGRQPMPPRFEFRSQAFLGVRLGPAADDAGVVVTEIVEASPAAEAGMVVDDVIVAVDDTQVSDPRALTEAIAAFDPGDTITLTILRDDEEQTLEVTLSERPMAGFEGRPPRGFEFSLGASEITFDAETGVVEIVMLDDAGPLAESGLQTGDRITAINGEALGDDPLMLMQGVGETVMLTVERDGETLELEVPGAVMPLLFITSMDRMMIPGEMMPFEFDGPRMPFEFNGPNRPDRPGRPDMPPFGGRTVLGVAFEMLTPDLAADNDLDVTEGALIREVLAETPAEVAELQAGDVITAVDGDLVDEERTLSDRLFAYEPGDTITLTVIRDGETLEIEVTLDNIQMR